MSKQYNFALIVQRLVLNVLVVALFTTRADAREPWADPNLPEIAGLEAWFDAARRTGSTASNASEPLERWLDASGKQRHLIQTNPKHRPTIHEVAGSSVVRFDGLDDHFSIDKLAAEFPDLTVVLAMTPFDNPGGYRAIFAINRTGGNDFQTGINIDQGFAASNAFHKINVEGAGFGGERDLMDGSHDFGSSHIVSVVCKSGDSGVQVFLNGRLVGKRERQPSRLHMDRLTLGARFYNLGAAPVVTGFFSGDIAEALVFSGSLSDDDRTRVETYLSKKHERLLKTKTPRPRQPGEGQRLISVPSPAVQMLVPGFKARELPINLSNINNLCYREDGKLVALGYNGNVYILSDTDNDGVEDHVETFWESNGRTRQPIGMALTPPNYKLGRGVFMPVVGKLSLVVDVDNDDKADKEIVVADGWTPLQHQVDSFGVAVDPNDHSVYFGLGTQNFANGYLLGPDGKAGYDLSSERGTILRVAPDFKSREVVCTGIRFSVGLAFNRLGDLFCSEQEGATWLANGNPFDELLHIQRGRHYGFPPRHPKHLPDVIDEPSTFDYTPQHQSTCGLHFNEPVHTDGPTFGPANWKGDAIVAGYARGKLYRTKLFKGDLGYIAQNQIIGSLNQLTVDACVSPTGNLVVATHSGGPDWGTGPSGPGKLYQIRYEDQTVPQPVLVWPESSRELRIAFDRAIPAESLQGILERIRIERGASVAAGDRFELHRPGYQVVQNQMSQARFDVPVYAVQMMPDQRTLIVTTGEQTMADGYAVTLFDDPKVLAALKESDTDQIKKLIPQAPDSYSDVDLGYSLNGVAAKWSSQDGKRQWTGWLPHWDLAASRDFTHGSALHDELWSLLEQPGELELETQLDLSSMLRPAVQPGATLDHTWPPEKTTVTWRSSHPIRVSVPNVVHDEAAKQTHVEFPADPAEWIAVRLVMKTGGAFSLASSWHTNEDSRHRPFPLRRFWMPWASMNETKSTSRADRPELAGGSWTRGRQLFFDKKDGCAKCHSVHGIGEKIGPDLTNAVHRDYASVLRDITEPSFAINPEYISQLITLNDGRVLTGVPRRDGDHLLIANERGESTRVSVSDIEEMQASTTSIMPKGLPQQLGPEKTRDLLTFLLTPGPQMPEYGLGRPPAPRRRAELQAVLASAEQLSEPRPLKVVLVAGPKDHGPGEHDYPAWLKTWSEWLSCAEHLSVETASPWPSGDQLRSADVLVFYQQGQWTADRARDIDALQARGGGLVYLHYAVDGGRDPDGFAERIGLAWRGGGSKFRHGELELHFECGSTHPIARNFDRVRFVDESYWQLVGDRKRIRLLATGDEDGSPQPLFWTVEKPVNTSDRPARVMVSILGHYSWTFDDPLFRVLILRSIAWTAHEPVDRFNEIVSWGARME